MFSLESFTYQWLSSCSHPCTRDPLCGCLSTPRQPIMGPFSKAPKGNGIGAMGSKNPCAYQNPCVSLLGMVLKTWVWFIPLPLRALPTFKGIPELGQPAKEASTPGAAVAQDSSKERAVETGCSGITLYQRLCYYIILPTSTAPLSDCTPL